MDIRWDDRAKEKFDKIINNLPQFHRTIAQKLVKEKAQILAMDRKSEVVEDKDLITAFFQEVPPAFKDMMKRLLSKLEIDYSQFI